MSLPAEKKFTEDTMLRLNAIHSALTAHERRIAFKNVEASFADDVLLATADRIYEFLKKGQEAGKDVKPKTQWPGGPPPGLTGVWNGPVPDPEAYIKPKDDGPSNKFRPVKDNPQA